MMRRIVAALFGATVAAGIVGVVRQRREAQAIRRGEIPRASAAADIPLAGPIAPWAERLSAWVPEPPATRLGRTLAAVWSGPMTAAGFLLALAGGRLPRWDAELGCFVARGVGGLSSIALRAVGADANTIGQVVLSRVEDPHPVLLAHEAVHARQTQRLGPVLLPLYLWLGARYGYRNHPLERAARLGARRFRDATLR
ncbi:MAG: hypothetical protein WD638_05425 [Nitriliruptoraceae bacterium]